MGVNNIYPEYIGRKDQRGRDIREGNKVEFTLIHTCGRKKHVFTGTVKRLDLDGRPYIETDNWNINYLLSEVARIKILR